MQKYMIATTALHQLGDISCPVSDGDYSDNLCAITEEDESNYIGMWVTGFGFFGVKFPKETTRELTPEEIDYFHGRSIQINSNPSSKLNIKDYL